MQFDWTDERVEDLKRLWAEGLSCSQIVIELGGGLSRSAVIGKVHRLRLARRNDYSTAPERAARAPWGSRTRGRTENKGASVARAPRKRKAPIAAYRNFDDRKFADDPDPLIETGSDREIPIEQRKTLLQLAPDTCRWPVGDVGAPGFFFCGAEPVVRGRPYCAAHCVRAFNGLPRAAPSSATLERMRRAQLRRFGSQENHEKILDTDAA